MARFLKYEIPIEQSQQFRELIKDNSAWVSNGELQQGFDAVDILWENDPLPEFEPFEVYPDPCGVHTFMGCEGLYKIEYNRFMESFK